MKRMHLRLHRLPIIMHCLDTVINSSLFSAIQTTKSPFFIVNLRIPFPLIATATTI